MKKLWVLLGVAMTTGTLSSGSISVLAQSSAAQAQPRFRSSVDVVSVSAVVRDRKGRFVRDLLQQDFIVADGGEPRRIIDFHADSDGPVNLALIVDVSGSMRVGVKAVDARQAAKHLFSALRQNDRAALLAFDTRLQPISASTSDFKSLEAALEHIEPPFGQTSLYDAVAETARMVAREGGAARATNQPPQRSAVVVLTDGIDTRSRLTPEQVAAIASEIDVPVYIVAVMAAMDDPRNLPDKTNAQAGELRGLAQWTGGELFTASAPAHASLAARQIVDELRHQYVLAFEASSLPGWRSLEVRARDRDLTVRARAGYTAGETVGNPLGNNIALFSHVGTLNADTPERSPMDVQKLGGHDEETCAGYSGSRARARRYHRLRHQEDGEHPRRGSEREGRDALEVR